MKAPDVNIYLDSHDCYLLRTLQAKLKVAISDYNAHKTDETLYNIRAAVADHEKYDISNALKASLLDIKSKAGIKDSVSIEKLKMCALVD